MNEYYYYLTRYRTARVYNDTIDDVNVLEYIKKEHPEYLTEHLITYYVLSLLSFKNIPLSLITANICDEFVRYGCYGFFEDLPNKFKTNDDIYRYCKIRHTVIRQLTKEQIYSNDKLIKFIVDKHPAYFEYIPEKYVTDDVMYRAVIQKGSLIDKVPERIIDENLIKYIPRIDYIPTKFITEDFINYFIEKYTFSKIDKYDDVWDNDECDELGEYVQLFINNKIELDAIPDYILYDENFTSRMGHNDVEKIKELYKFDRDLIDMSLIEKLIEEGVNINDLPYEFLTLDLFIFALKYDMLLYHKSVPEQFLYDAKFLANFGFIYGNFDRKVCTNELFKKIIDTDVGKRYDDTLLDCWPSENLTDDMIEYAISKKPRLVAGVSKDRMLINGEKFYKIAAVGRINSGAIKLKWNLKNVEIMSDIDFIF